MSLINLNDIGLTESIVQEAQMYKDNLHLARVSAQFKDMYCVITEYGEIHAEIRGKLGFLASSKTSYPAVGDWVLVDRLDDSNGNAIIHNIISRKSTLERKAAGKAHDNQVIAVNIDYVFICMSLNNNYNPRRIERYLSVVWDSMATPVILLTKADLCDEISSKIMEIESIAIGVDVVVTTCTKDDGFSSIYKYLTRGKTIAFVGSSGVGKSTLINKLYRRDILATELTRSDDKGKHTTTNRQLFALPCGAVVIDTPGMRELQIAGADLSRSFSDIETLAEKCFFKDCKHESEPNCAVLKAIDDGFLTKDRLESYNKLQKEMLFEERKKTMTASQMEKKKVIDMLGSLKGTQMQTINRKKKGR